LRPIQHDGHLTPHAHPGKREARGHTLPEICSPIELGGQ
jgi:hypothetical protein